MRRVGETSSAKGASEEAKKKKKRERQTERDQFAMTN